MKSRRRADEEQMKSRPALEDEQVVELCVTDGGCFTEQRAVKVASG